MLLNTVLDSRNIAMNKIDKIPAFLDIYILVGSGETENKQVTESCVIIAETSIDKHH